VNNVPGVVSGLDTRTEVDQVVERREEEFDQSESSWWCCGAVGWLVRQGRMKKVQ